MPNDDRPPVIAAPPSKSYAVRAVVAAMLATGGRVENTGNSDDVRAAVRAAKAWREGGAEGWQAEVCRKDGAKGWRAGVTETENLYTGAAVCGAEAWSAGGAGNWLAEAVAWSADGAEGWRERAEEWPAETYAWSVDVVETEVCRKDGAKVWRERAEAWSAGGAGNWLAEAVTIDVGESALAAHIFACLAALSNRKITITGHGTLPARPMNLRPLGELGAHVEGGRLPLTICGPMRGGRITVDGSAGSQVITGLLMSLPLAVGDSIVTVTNPVSIPYIDMTLDVLARFGIAVERAGWEFRIGGGQRYVPCDYVVEGDWSGASCILAAGAFSRRGVTVTGLSPTSHQGDKVILEVLEAAGAEIVRGVDRVTVRRGDGGLRAFVFDATDCPDLFPALVALAVACEGESILKGVGRLHHKESSRGEVLRREYGKMGVEVVLDGDTMRVSGGMPTGGRVSAHGDHRIAMSLAVSGLRAQKGVVVDGAACVAKSYPEFWDDLKKIRL